MDRLSSRHIGISKAQRSIGFSLLEILIAMAILAIMVGISVISMGSSSDKYARQEVNRLLAAIELVRDLAVIKNQEYGLSVNETGYQFLVLNETDDNKPAQWQVVAENKALAEHQFVEGVEINIAIDGENIFKSDEDDVDIFEEDVDIFEDEEEKPKIEPPQIYFLSTGEQNKFTIAIASNDDDETQADEMQFYRIRGTLAGELKYEGPIKGSLFNDIEIDYSEDS
jgi:general secretion pathway protein H